jgi:hypothetical protein
MKDNKKIDIMKAINLNMSEIEKNLKTVDFNNHKLRDELIEIKNDVKDMHSGLDEVIVDTRRRLDLIDRIVDDHLYHISTIEKPVIKKFRIVR